jgi:hypothetical protein
VVLSPATLGLVARSFGSIAVEKKKEQDLIAFFFFILVS